MRPSRTPLDDSIAWKNKETKINTRLTDSLHNIGFVSMNHFDTVRPYSTFDQINFCVYYPRILVSIIQVYCSIGINDFYFIPNSFGVQHSIYSSLIKCAIFSSGINKLNFAIPSMNAMKTHKMVAVEWRNRKKQDKKGKCEKDRKNNRKKTKWFSFHAHCIVSLG